MLVLARHTRPSPMPGRTISSRCSMLCGSITGSGLARLAGWDHPWVIFSSLYLLVRSLLGCLMVLARREVSKDAELLVLRHENAVLRRQISRVRYQRACRLWLAALSRLIPRRRWGEMFTVTPATLLAWHRRLVSRKWDHTNRRHPGRPSTQPRSGARDPHGHRQPTWGRRRVEGELVKLGHPIAASTVWQSCTPPGSIPRSGGPARPGSSS